MKLLIIPMFALSPMGGPWTRAQRIAAAFQDAGHEVVLGMAPDGNCANPVTARTLQLAAPAPLGAPMAIAKRTFPLAAKLGITGRKPVGSFEEVLWLTGNLAYGYAAQCVDTIMNFIRDEHVDAVYSEFSLHAIIAAKAEGVPVVGSHSFPTRSAFASAPGKAGGIRRVLGECGLPSIQSALDLFSWQERIFIPSCPALEPYEDDRAVFCGFLGETPGMPACEREAIVIYMGTGTVARGTLAATVHDLARSTGLELYVAGMESERVTERNLHVARRFDFSELLPRTCAFINHGGQNSIMDALLHGTPQIVYPGKVFERRYNAQSIRSAGAGICLEAFTAHDIEAAVDRLCADESFRVKAAALRDQLASLGGTRRIVTETEAFITTCCG